MKEISITFTDKDVMAKLLFPNSEIPLPGFLESVRLSCPFFATVEELTKKAALQKGQVYTWTSADYGEGVYNLLLSGVRQHEVLCYVLLPEGDLPDEIDLGDDARPASMFRLTKRINASV